MYLHILNKFGKTLTVLNTRQRLSLRERADLVYGHQNPLYFEQMEALRVFLALPGEQSRLVRRSPPDRFQGVGVLSPHKNLNAMPRFSGSGEIKVADIPKKLRGEELFDYLDTLTRIDGPEIKTGNLVPAWDGKTNPRRVSKVTAAQRELAATLRGQGVTWRKVGEIVGVNHSTLQQSIQRGSETAKTA